MGVIQHYEMVEETTSTTGTGALTLTGALSGRRSFALAVGVNEYFPYRLEAADGTYYEIGLGKYTSTGTVDRVEVYRAMVLSGGTYFNGTAKINLPAGVKRVAIVQTADESPVASSISRLDGARINRDGGASWALAWGRLANVESGQGGMALGADTYSMNGGAAIGYGANALGLMSFAMPSGVAGSSSRGSVAGPGSSVRDGWCMMIGAPADRTTDARSAQGGFLARGQTTSGTTPAAMKLIADVAGAGYLYDLTLLGHKNGGGGMYAARVRIAATGATGAPTILQSETTGAINSGTGSTIAAPVIAAGSSGDITVTVTGIAAENWTWALTGPCCNTGLT